MHPECRAVPPWQAQWPKIQIIPVNGLRSQPSNWCTVEPHQRNQKEKIITPASMACAWNPHVAIDDSWKCSSNGGKKKVVVASSYAMHTVQRKVSAQTAASSSTLRQRQGQTRKVNDCFILLKRITRLKSVNSEIGSEARISYLERYSPKGSCHHGESSMSHTRAQNCYCEFCCGMHLTCETLIIPDRNGSVKRPERKSRSHHHHSQC